VSGEVDAASEAF